jgi:hypothetical protein
MSRSYHLGQTYEPTQAFDSWVGSLDPLALCESIGIARSTIKRVIKLRTASPNTARRLAAGMALIVGVHPALAFQLLFERRPRVAIVRQSLSKVPQRQQHETGEEAQGS